MNNRKAIVVAASIEDFRVEGNRNNWLHLNGTAQSFEGQARGQVHSSDAAVQGVMVNKLMH
jgi:hypothetical protein